MKTTDIVSIAEFYNRFPYPHYPLLAKPRWQDGYLNSSTFGKFLQKTEGASDKNKSRNGCFQPPKILIVGCGEILPYLCSKWEHPRAHIDAVDLSSRSLKRAKFRTIFSKQRICFHKMDINQFLELKATNKIRYDFVQSFGVFHHLLDPGQTLSLLRDCVEPSASLRLMIYNSHGRDFIHRVQNVLESLDIVGDKKSGLRFARELTKTLAEVSPRYAERFRCMGSSIFGNQTRFADTFLNPLEQRLGINQWFDLFSDSGFVPYSLFDRYGELDDLENPLLKMPPSSALFERAQDRRFEGNLEVFLQPNNFSAAEPYADGYIPPALKFLSPPKDWFNFPETSGLSRSLQKLIWHTFLETLENKSRPSQIETLRDQLSPSAFMRLSRIGAILTRLPSRTEFRKRALLPLSDRMQPLQSPELGEISAEKILQIMRKREVDQHYLKKLECILNDKSTLDQIKSIS